MQLSVLSPQEILKIHDAALQILEKTGVRLSLPDARTVLLDAGCKIENERVCFSPELVEHCLTLCPHTFTLHGRGGKVMTLGSGCLHWRNTGGAHTIYDPKTDSFHPAGIQELRNATRLLDGLEGVDEVTPFFTPQDVPAPLINLAMYRHALSQTIKPLGGPGLQAPQEASYAYEMAAVIGPPTDILSISVSPISPLYFPDEVAAAIMETARLGVPFWPMPSPNAGGTAPMTLAGALAQQNAEILASIVLAQLVHPGLPVTYCGRLSILEPRTGGASWGVPALGLAAAACVQIGHYYHLPVNVYGLASDSNHTDIQNGYEHALNAVLPALAGADQLSGIGDLGAGIISSYAQMVCDNDIVMSINKLVSGIQVNENDLAVDLVAEVMQTSGHFLAEHHTVKALRKGEIYYPPLADRRLYDEWDSTGRGGMLVNAVAKAERILHEHEVPALEDSQEKELDRILQAAAKELIE